MQTINTVISPLINKGEIMNVIDIQNKLEGVWEDAMREIYAEWCEQNGLEIFCDKSRDLFAHSEANDAVKKFVRLHMRWVGEVA